MNILVVEDNLTNLAVLKAIVGRIPGCTPECFSNPLKALEAAKETPCELVLVDFKMPQMDGVSFVRAMRQIPSYTQVPIIMITSDDDHKLRISAIEAGVNEFLNKPVSADELRLRSKNLLTLRKTQVALADRAQHLANEVEAATRMILDREEEMIWRLARAIEYRDGGTGEHINRVAAVSKIIAEELGLSKEHCRDIYRASPLHDVGKIGVSDAILNKPGKLDPEEIEEMRKHVRYGEEILAGGNSDLLRVAEKIAKSHHEKWDGTGYPYRLSGKDIPIEGRIAAVADVFDALCTRRPYKKAWSLEDARSLVNRESGAHFDPDCVAAFEKGWPRIEAVMTKSSIDTH